MSSRDEKPTYQKLEEVFKNLKLMKAGGPDPIGNEMIKYGGK